MIAPNSSSRTCRALDTLNEPAGISAIKVRFADRGALSFLSREICDTKLEAPYRIARADGRCFNAGWDDAKAILVRFTANAPDLGDMCIDPGNRTCLHR